MTHLQDTEFVDFAEGTLSAPRAAHLDTCAECREQAEAVSAALRETAVVEIPEPSPLFWDHFTARVHDQVANETPDRASWWTAVSIRSLVPLVAALAVVVVIALLPRSTEAPRAPEALVASGATVDVAPDIDLPVDAKNAEVWAVLTAAASDVALDEAHAAGMAARPGAVDHAVTHLNQAELTELGRLLQTQLKRSSD